MPVKTPKSLFLTAIEDYPPDEWPKFLDVACEGDEKLKVEVNNLLKEHQRLGPFREDGRVAFAMSEHTATVESQTEGTCIGPYKLREQIGEGGMGVVYVAEQTEPVRRKVAIKLIRPGMASKEVIARFEAERQALAMMDHPNIARVFDGGVTDTEQPYFVMELVQGLPISDFCDEHRLPTNERLKLFVKVCNAVRHAHQRGVIHRDLKPSNVIVAEVDDSALPKVIDFGVAKAVSQSLTEETLYTHFSQMVGTPLYMSPEQTGLGVVDVDTRSDVYSLGVLLYELLTGSTPFDGETLKQVGFDEMRRIIREEDPLRPSDKLSTLKLEAVSTIAEKRRTDPRQLKDVLRGELDWSVAKALEKDRNRRYESVRDFAADVQRYLDGEAMEACPPSAFYRLRKAVLRHKAAVTTAILVLLALIAGIVGTSWQAWRAATALEMAEVNKDLATTERTKAVDNFHHAQEALNKLLAKVDTEAILENPELHPLRTELVEIAQQYYQQFTKKHQDDPALSSDLADAYLQLASVSYSLGKVEDGREAIEQARGIRKRLMAQHAGDDEYQHDLALFYLAASPMMEPHGTTAYSGAIKYSEELDSPAHRLTHARACSEQARWLYKLFQNTANTQHKDEGYRWAQKAETTFQQLLEQNAESTDYRLGLAKTQLVLARYLNFPGNDEEVNRYLDSSIGALEALVEQHPNDTGYRLHLAKAYAFARRFDDATSVLSKLVEEHPTVVQYQVELATTYLQMQKVHAVFEDATMDAAEKSVAIYRRLVERYPENKIYLGHFGQASTLLGDTLRGHGRVEESIATYESAAKALSQTEQLFGVWKAYVGLYTAHESVGDLDASLRVAHQAADINKELRDTYGDDAKSLVEAAENRYFLAFLARQQGSVEEALAESQAALRLGHAAFHGSNASDLPMDVVFDGRFGIRTSHLLVGQCAALLGNYDEAAAAFRAAMDAEAQIVRDVSGSLVHRSPSRLYDEYIVANRQREQPDDVVKVLQQELTTWKELEERSRFNWSCQIRQLEIHIRLANEFTKLGQDGQASRHYRNAQLLVEALVEHEWHTTRVVPLIFHLCSTSSDASLSPAGSELIALAQQYAATALQLQKNTLKKEPFRVDWDRWSHLVLGYYRQREWRGVEEEARLGIELAPRSKRHATQLLNLAPFLLLAGEEREYHRTCVSLSGASSSKQGDAITAVVRLCLLDPLGGDSELLLPLVREACKSTGRDHLLHVAYYRFGETEKAIEGLTHDLESPPQGEPPIEIHLALAHALASDWQESREWLEIALKRYDSTWRPEVRVAYEALCREVKELLKQSSKEQ